MQDNGLYGGHEYSLLKLELVQNNEGKYVELVNIRNPWGKGEFNGNWSDSSKMWETITPEKQAKLLVKREDGAFWMCYKDWVTLFSSFDVCLLPTFYSPETQGPTFEFQD